MRTLGLVVALLVTFSISAAAQAPGPSRSPSHPSPYFAYGYPGAKADTGQTASGNPDPYLQRYYSHSQGWTYYNLPPDSAARRTEDQ